MFHSLMTAVEDVLRSAFQPMRKHMARWVACGHCARLGRDVNALSRWRFQECTGAHLAGASYLLCEDSVRIPMTLLAPDVTFTGVPFVQQLSVGDRVGEGGAGCVFQGVADGEVVAVKEFKVKPGKDETDKFRQFYHEVSVMSSIKHPNLIRLLGIMTSPHLRIVMEFCPLPDLSKHLYDTALLPVDAFPLSLRLRILLDSARGLHFLHSLEPPLAHRDVRSPNIFLITLNANGAEAVAKLGDFGMSRIASTTSQQTMNTWKWAAPEAISHVAYNERADLFSFGVVASEVLTRAPPYEYDKFSSHFTRLSVWPEFMNGAAHCYTSQLDLEAAALPPPPAGHAWCAACPHHTSIPNVQWEPKFLRSLREDVAAGKVRPIMPASVGVNGEEHVPDDVLAVLRACLEADPNDRPALGDVVSALEGALGMQAPVGHKQAPLSDSGVGAYTQRRSVSRLHSEEGVRARSPSGSMISFPSRSHKEDASSASGSASPPVTGFALCAHAAGDARVTTMQRFGRTDDELRPDVAAVGGSSFGVSPRMVMVPRVDAASPRPPSPGPAASPFALSPRGSMGAGAPGDAGEHAGAAGVDERAGAAACSPTCCSVVDRNPSCCLLRVRRGAGGGRGVGDHCGAACASSGVCCCDSGGGGGESADARDGGEDAAGRDGAQGWASPSSAGSGGGGGCGHCVARSPSPYGSRNGSASPSPAISPMPTRWHNAVTTAAAAPIGIRSRRLGKLQQAKGRSMAVLDKETTIIGTELTGEVVMLRSTSSDASVSAVVEGHKGTVYCIEPVTSGKGSTQVWTGGEDATVVVWSRSKRKGLRRQSVLRGHEASVRCLAQVRRQLADGRRQHLVYSADLSGIIIAWNASRPWNQVYRVELRTPVQHIVAVTSPKPYLSVGCAGRVHLFELDLKVKRTWPFGDPRMRVDTLAFVTHRPGRGGSGRGGRGGAGGADGGWGAESSDNSDSLTRTSPKDRRDSLTRQSDEAVASDVLIGHRGLHRKAQSAAVETLVVPQTSRRNTTDVTSPVVSPVTSPVVPRNGGPWASSSPVCVGTPEEGSGESSDAAEDDEEALLSPLEQTPKGVAATASSPTPGRSGAKGGGGCGSSGERASELASSGGSSVGWQSFRETFTEMGRTSLSEFSDDHGDSSPSVSAKRIATVVVSSVSSSSSSATRPAAISSMVRGSPSLTGRSASVDDSGGTAGSRGKRTSLDVFILDESPHKHGPSPRSSGSSTRTSAATDFGEEILPGALEVFLSDMTAGATSGASPKEKQHSGGSGGGDGGGEEEAEEEEEAHKGDAAKVTQRPAIVAPELPPEVRPASDSALPQVQRTRRSGTRPDVPLARSVDGMHSEGRGWRRAVASNIISPLTSPRGLIKEDPLVPTSQPLVRTQAQPQPPPQPPVDGGVATAACELWTATFDELLVWDVLAEDCIASCQESFCSRMVCSALVFHEESKCDHLWLASADNYVSVWNTQSKQCIALFRLDHSVQCIIAQPGGTIWTCDRGGSIREWEYM